MESILNKVKEDRAFFDTLGKFYAPDSSVGITLESIEGVNCYLFSPERSDENSIIIYLHGGMFGFGSIRSHQPMVSHLASTLSTKILFIDYSLAPEKPYPNGLNDVLKVYRELIRKAPKTKVAVFGDSAGGGLAVALINKLIEQKLPKPAGVILFSPWIYLTCDTGSYEARKKMDVILTKDKLLEYANYYVADNWNEADPGQLNFSSFPPLFILVGGNEILFDDSRLFNEKIRSVQPDTQMKEYAGQSHVWLLTDIGSDPSKTALTDIKRFFEKTMGS